MVKRLVLCVAIVVLARVGQAAPATHLSVIFPCCPAGPGTCRVIVTQPGEVRCINLEPHDANEQTDPTWVGTVVFTSSDPLATLPAPCTFSPTNPTCTSFADTVFQTLGPQTITVSDMTGILTPGTAQITVVVGEPANQVPTTGWQAKAAAVALLALVGASLLKRSF